MKSKRAKSLQRVGGKTMLEMICKTAESISAKITLIVGFDKESIISESKKFNFDISTCVQSLPIGTGDAVKCGINEVDNADKVLVLYGDVPLIKKETLVNLVSIDDQSLTILSTEVDDPFGYGRVKKDDDGNVTEIIEEKDASNEDKKIQEIFTGILCCNKALLQEALKEIKNDNAAGEYYLTDIVSIINKKGFKIKTCIVANDEVKALIQKRVIRVRGNI